MQICGHSDKRGPPTNHRLSRGPGQSKRDRLDNLGFRFSQAAAFFFADSSSYSGQQGFGVSLDATLRREDGELVTYATSGAEGLGVQVL